MGRNSLWCLCSYDHQRQKIKFEFSDSPAMCEGLPLAKTHKAFGKLTSAGRELSLVGNIMKRAIQGDSANPPRQRIIKHARQ